MEETEPASPSTPSFPTHHHSRAPLVQHHLGAQAAKVCARSVSSASSAQLAGSRGGLACITRRPRRAHAVTCIPTPFSSSTLPWGPSPWDLCRRVTALPRDYAEIMGSDVRPARGEPSRARSEVNVSQRCRLRLLVRGLLGDRVHRVTGKTLYSAANRRTAERSPTFPDVSFSGVIPAFPGKASTPRGGALTTTYPRGGRRKARCYRMV